MIQFSDIYTKAVKLFDDPKITHAYKNDPILFNKYMYGYLSTVSIYEPVIIGQILSDVVEPIGQMEVFDTDGEHNVFNYTIDIPEGSQIKFMENDKVVQGQIDSDNKTVTFPDILSVGQYSLEYYYSGHYVANFNSITQVPNSLRDITLKVTNILARLIVIAWSEETENMLVDIQGLLRDSDFKATPNSQILNSKVNWVDSLKDRNRIEQNKLAWYIRYSSNTAKFKRF